MRHLRHCSYCGRKTVEKAVPWTDFDGVHRAIECPRCRKIHTTPGAPIGVSDEDHKFQAILEACRRSSCS